MMWYLTITHSLQTAKLKVDSYDAEISLMKLEIKDLCHKLEAANAQAHSFEREKKRLDQVQERCKIAEKRVTRATDICRDKAPARADVAQKETSEMQKLLENGKIGPN
ncbi:unnamed protein product [Prunus armeniaca]